MIKNTTHNFAKWAIVRPSSIWGPWFKAPYRTFFDMIYKKTYFDMGKISCTKTYGYVENSVYQIMKLLFSDETNGNTYYLGDYEPVFISDWSKEISLLLHNKKPIELPFFVFKVAATTGDLLQTIHLPFPMTSFRLNNMTTNNIIDLKETFNIVGNLPVDRMTGVEKTLEWLNYKK